MAGEDADSWDSADAADWRRWREWTWQHPSQYDRRDEWKVGVWNEARQAAWRDVDAGAAWGDADAARGAADAGYHLPQWLQTAVAAPSPAAPHDDGAPRDAQALQGLRVEDCNLDGQMAGPPRNAYGEGVPFYEIPTDFSGVHSHRQEENPYGDGNVFSAAPSVAPSVASQGSLPPATAPQLSDSASSDDSTGQAERQLHLSRIREVATAAGGTAEIAVAALGGRRKEPPPKPPLAAAPKKAPPQLPPDGQTGGLLSFGAPPDTAPTEVQPIQPKNPAKAPPQDLVDHLERTRRQRIQYQRWQANMDLAVAQPLPVKQPPAKVQPPVGKEGKPPPPALWKAPPAAYFAAIGEAPPQLPHKAHPQQPPVAAAAVKAPPAAHYAAIGVAPPETAVAAAPAQGPPPQLFPPTPLAAMAPVISELGFDGRRLAEGEPTDGSDEMTALAGRQLVPREEPQGPLPETAVAAAPPQGQPPPQAPTVPVYIVPSSHYWRDFDWRSPPSWQATERVATDDAAAAAIAKWQPLMGGPTVDNGSI